MKNTKDTRAVPSYNGLRVKEQLRLLPGHLIVGLWCLFTLGMLLWIVAASLSTSPEIMRGEVLKCYVVPRPEAAGKLDKAAIIAWCRSKLAHYKVPRHVEFRAELPKSAIGQVLRNGLDILGVSAPETM